MCEWNTRSEPGGKGWCDDAECDDWVTGGCGLSQRDTGYGAGRDKSDGSFTM